MALVAEHSDVPVPADRRRRGRPATCSARRSCVMEAVAGRTPTDNPPYVFGGWLYDATPEERRELQDATVDGLAGIHGIADASTVFATWSTAEGDAAARPRRRTSAPTTSGPARPTACASRSSSGPSTGSRPTGRDDPASPVSSAGATPAPATSSIDGFAPVAVLDWEMAADRAPRGRPRLGRVPAPLLPGHRQRLRAARHPRLLPPRTTSSRRTRSSAGTRSRDFDWYLVYAALRHAVVMSQVKRRMIHFGEEHAARGPRRLRHAPSALKRSWTGRTDGH